MRIFVNKEKRTCIAILEFRADPYSDARDILHQRFTKLGVNSTNFYWDLLSTACGKYMKTSYTGRAKCDPNDTWNEKLGIELATERAYQKYWRDVDKVAWEIYNELCRITSAAEKVSSWGSGVFEKKMNSHHSAKLMSNR